MPRPKGSKNKKTIIKEQQNELERLKVQLEKEKLEKERLRLEREKIEKSEEGNNEDNTVDNMGDSKADVNENKENPDKDKGKVEGMDKHKNSIQDSGEGDKQNNNDITNEDNSADNGNDVSDNQGNKSGNTNGSEDTVNTEKIIDDINNDRDKGNIEIDSNEQVGDRTAEEIEEDLDIKKKILNGELEGQAEINGQQAGIENQAIGFIDNDIGIVDNFRPLINNTVLFEEKPLTKQEAVLLDTNLDRVLQKYAVKTTPEIALITTALIIVMPRAYSLYMKKRQTPDMSRGIGDRRPVESDNEGGEE